MCFWRCCPVEFSLVQRQAALPRISWLCNSFWTRSERFRVPLRHVFSLTQLSRDGCVTGDFTLFIVWPFVRVCKNPLVQLYFTLQQREISVATLCSGYARRLGFISLRFHIILLTCGRTHRWQLLSNPWLSPRRQFSSLHQQVTKFYGSRYTSARSFMSLTITCTAFTVTFNSSSLLEHGETAMFVIRVHVVCARRSCVWQLASSETACAMPNVQNELLVNH